ncbi:ankyrin repeat-containing domain protein [Tuber brumale]|nr:ankyrin repeat-containing domain protein [Tuber brumale]
MSLLDLPNELVLMISAYLETPELNSLLKTNHRFTALLNQDLWDRVLSLLAPIAYNVLLHAVSTHNRVGLQGLLAGGIEDQIGETLWIKVIHHVATDESGEYLSTLLGCGVDPSIRYSDSRTILSHAAEAGCVNVVRALLARNDADVNVPDEIGRGPLSLAALGGHKEVVELLLGHRDISINSTDCHARPALWYAVINGTTEVVAALLANPHLELNICDVHCRTTLHWACGEGLSNMVRLLLADERTDYNQSSVADLAPLDIAASNGHAETVRMLLELDGIDVSKRWPLYSAVNSEAEEVVRLLLDDKRIDVNRGPGGDTPLGLATRARYNLIIRLLLGRKDVLVNISATSGETPLCVVASEGNTPLVQLLLAHPGIDVNLVDIHGYTPLISAIARGKDEVVRLLLDDERTDVNFPYRSEHQTPLYWAVAQERCAIVRLLLSDPRVRVNSIPEANINTMEHDLETLIGLAIHQQTGAVVPVPLDEHGFNINARDAKHWAPVRILMRTGDYSVVSFRFSRQGVRGLRYTAPTYSSTPLIEAAIRVLGRIFQMLLDNTDIKANQTSALCYTPVYHAKITQRGGTVHFLLADERVDICLPHNVTNWTLHDSTMQGRLQMTALIITDIGGH